MGRVKLELPEQFGFSTEIAIRIGDVNYGGHLGNDTVLALAHEARVQFLKFYGFKEMDAGGAGFIIVDAVVVYRSQGFYGQTAKIEVTVGEFSRVGCDFFYRLCDKESGREMVRAKTGIVFFDYKRQEVVAVPKLFRTTFAFVEKSK